MHLRVKLFATLSRHAPSGRAGVPFDVDLPAGASLGDLVTALKLDPEETRVIFVNGLIQTPDYIPAPGDEIGIFPPIGGG